MAKKDPRVDAYIAKSAEFARPILVQLRETVHAACPAVEETMKWSFPHFLHDGMLCSMASFKKHCAFGFWKGSLVVGNDRAGEAMGHLGRITSLDDLPSKRILTAWIRKAVKLNAEGTKAPARTAAKPKAPLPVPSDFAAALAKNGKAKKIFDALSPSCRREYLEWITEAKRAETRSSRIATSIEWISQGKRRNWKYEAC